MAAKNSSKLKHKAIELITPSTSSAVLCVVIGLVVSLGIIFVNRYRPGRLGINSLTNKLHLTLSGNYLTGSLTHDIWVNRLPIISFYLVLILLAYLLAADINKFSRKKIKAHKFLLYAISRVVVAIVLLAYLSVLFNNILAYVAKIVIVSTTASNVWAVSGYILLSILITSIAVHISVVLLRLLSLRTRLVNL